MFLMSISRYDLHFDVIYSYFKSKAYDRYRNLLRKNKLQ